MKFQANARDRIGSQTDCEVKPNALLERISNARGDLESLGTAALREVIAPCARALGAIA
jgi:hypothetical protein